MDPQNTPKLFPALPKDLTGLTVEELTALHEEHKECARKVLAKTADFSVFGDVSDEDRAKLTVAEFENGVVAMKAIEAELEVRAEGEGNLDETLQSLAADVDLGEDAPNPDAPDPDAPAPDPDNPEALAAKPDDDPDAKPDEAPADEPETVVASADAPRPLRLPATPRQHAPAIASLEERAAQFVAQAGIPGIAAGQPLDRLGLREAFLALDDQATTLPEGARQNVKVARLSYGEFYPEERTFTADLEENLEKVMAIVGPEAYGYNPLNPSEEVLVASGGICAAPTPFYEVVGYGRAHRPVRDALPSFNARRGGIQVAGGLSIGSIDETAYGHVTAAEDETGGTTGAKTCWHIDCPEWTTTTIEAIFRCLEIGNFNARTWPELIDRFVSETMAAHARYAESRLLTKIAAGSTTLTQAKKYGALSTIVTGLVQLAARYRSQYRTDPNLMFQALLPQWLPDMLFLDQVHSDVQKFNVTRAGITRLLREGGVEPAWYADEAAGTGQIMAADVDASSLDCFPSHVFGYIFPAGTWLHLDGGVLDLGVVRDSDLNLSNDYQQFAEDFENVAFTGIESVELDWTVYQDGTYAPAGTAITC